MREKILDEALPSPISCLVAQYFSYWMRLRPNKWFIIRPVAKVLLLFKQHSNLKAQKSGFFGGFSSKVLVFILWRNVKKKTLNCLNEDFFGSAKNIELILFRIFELRWFQICVQISYIFLGSKTFQRGVKMAKKGHSGPTLKGCSLRSKKNMKNLSTDLESAKFKYSKKYQFDIFDPAEKIYIFSSSFFIFIFQFKKNLVN